VFEWPKTFPDVREDVEDEELLGRLVTMKIDENVEKVRTSVRIDRLVGVRMVAEEFNMDEEALRHFNNKF
jgi:hypothetical protein